MRQVLIIAGKELRDGRRNRWVLATTVLLAALALTLAFLGAAPTGSVKLSALAVTTAAGMRQPAGAPLMLHRQEVTGTMGVAGLAGLLASS